VGGRRGPDRRSKIESWIHHQNCQHSFSKKISISESNHYSVHGLRLGADHRWVGISALALAAAEFSAAGASEGGGWRGGTKEDKGVFVVGFGPSVFDCHFYHKLVVLVQLKNLTCSQQQSHWMGDSGLG
jgi:hypothetical protein